MNNKSIKIGRLFVLPVVMVGLLLGCARFLEIDPPTAQVNSETVFRNAGTATGALTGLYENIIAGFASGGISVYTGLSADELIFNNTGISPQPDWEELNDNNLSPTNGQILSLWSRLYSVIYGANSILERTADNDDLEPELIAQLRGESHFIRAFCYFYLVNLFGDVPLATSTDYRTNGLLPRSDVEAVYDLIVHDLEVASGLLEQEYVDPMRFRVNRWAAVAFLARVQLYLGNWQIAAELSTQVIERQEFYRIEPELNDVFLVGSSEAIWKWGQRNANTNTAEASIFVRENQHHLAGPVLDWFAVDDKRRYDWIWLKDTVQAVYVPYKYKSTSVTETTEHTIILRFAEQYLNRAESLARLGQTDDAVADLDVIRGRAGLPLVGDIKPDIGQSELVDSIFVERHREFFSEWGHRWFDLKRTGRAVETLGASKPGFTVADEWYPIPESEVLKNPNLNK